jgi:4-amino-4-deoxy-L-arabinose transferase-like glycosyltransferase
LVPRFVNLGSFSMWFDEVAETLQASGSLAQTWAELKSDVVHPPLDGLLTWLFLHLGLDETARRWVPIAFGVVTVLLLASWTARRFGRIAGVATGLFAACAPLHVHYSQELRPYALALLCVALAVAAVDRLLARVYGRHLILAALAVLGCLYSLYFAGLVLVFVGWLILDTAITGRPEEAGRARSVLTWSPALLLGLGLAYLPWLSTALAMRQRRSEHGANHWTWRAVAERWQDLTVGSGTSASGWGSALALLLVLLGSIRAVRTAAGRAVLAAALCGTVGVDLLLLHANHWSNPRYDLIGWLFLAVLAGMGAGLLMRLPRGRAVTAAVLLLLVCAQALGIVRDHHLRQDWRRIAEAVDAVWRPGEPVLSQNRSTNALLQYYLSELHSPAAAALAPVGGSHLRLAELWPGDRCALLVLRKGGQTGRVVGLTQDADEIARYPASGARLRLLTPQFRERLFRRSGGGEHSLGRATPQALTLHCERELPPALRASRVDRPYDPLRRLLGKVGDLTGATLQEAFNLTMSRHQG